MTTEVASQDVTVTANAARRIGEMIAQEERLGLKLRVAVAGGGCSGFQYTFDFDDSVEDGDIIVARDGIEVLIDSTSLEFLGGAEIDFVDDVMGAAFRINNPNVQAMCGCGISFSI